MTEQVREHSLLNMDQAAAQLNVSPRFIRKTVHEKQIPVVRIGRLVRFYRDDLDTFARSRRHDVQSAGRGESTTTSGSVE